MILRNASVTWPITWSWTGNWRSWKRLHYACSCWFKFQTCELLIWWLIIYHYFMSHRKDKNLSFSKFHQHTERGQFEDIRKWDQSKISENFQIFEKIIKKLIFNQLSNLPTTYQTWTIQIFIRHPTERVMNIPPRFFLLSDHQPIRSWCTKKSLSKHQFRCLDRFLKIVIIFKTKKTLTTRKTLVMTIIQPLVNVQ